MFSNLLSSLQLTDPEDSSKKKSSVPTKDSAGEGSSTATQGGHVSFWGVAAAVAGSVRATADDFVKTVKQTDWQSELTNFGKEFAHDTKSMGSNAVTLVDHLPLHLEAAADQPFGGEAQQFEQQDVSDEDAVVAAHIEQVGSALANFGRSLVVGTQEFVEQVRDAVETEIAAVVKDHKGTQRSRGAAASGSRVHTGAAGKYNRFEAEVTAMQRDSSTYCDEPEDKEDFAAWKTSFQLASMKSEINKIVKQNAFMSELQSRIVPLIVEYEDFWTRYFYRLHKLQVKEVQRQELHNRMSKETDMEVGWDDDDTTSNTRPGKPPMAIPPIATPSAAQQPAIPAAQLSVQAVSPGAPTSTFTPALIATSPARSPKAATSAQQPSTDAAAPASAPALLAAKSATKAATTTLQAVTTVAPSSDFTASPTPSTLDQRETDTSTTAQTCTAAGTDQPATVATAANTNTRPVQLAKATTTEVESPSTATAAIAAAALAAETKAGAGLASVSVERDGSKPDTASDIISPEWCVISNASASDAGVASLNPRADRAAQHTAASSEPVDEADEDDEELDGVTSAEDGAHGNEDEEDVDEDWGNWD